MGGQGGLSGEVERQTFVPVLLEPCTEVLFALGSGFEHTWNLRHAGAVLFGATVDIWTVTSCKSHLSAMSL